MNLNATSVAFLVHDSINHSMLQMRSVQLSESGWWWWWTRLDTIEWCGGTKSCSDKSRKSLFAVRRGDGGLIENHHRHYALTNRNRRRRTTHCCGGFTRSRIYWHFGWKSLFYVTHFAHVLLSLILSTSVLRPSVPSITGGAQTKTENNIVPPMGKRIDRWEISIFNSTDWLRASDDWALSLFQQQHPIASPWVGGCFRKDIDFGWFKIGRSCGAAMMRWDKNGRGLGLLGRHTKAETGKFRV